MDTFAQEDVARARREPPVPPDAPLAMTAPAFGDEAPAARRPGGRRPRLAAGTVLARLYVFLATLTLSGFGVHEMYAVVEVGGLTALEWLFLALFALSFVWIAFSAASALLGFLCVLLRRRPRLTARPSELDSTTAILMPVYNESPVRVAAALEAMAQSLHRLGAGPQFDFFILSDTSDPDIWVGEEIAFEALCARLPASQRVYYRHRPANFGRKAGNIADFVRRWGARYDHMIVLDADSVMAGETIVELARRMARDPDAGIIQTVPSIINGRSLYGRLQQFAGAVYGPIFASGLAAWHGNESNYWGHNAIIRTRAFADHCALPELPGRPPFGGHVLSHDFIEAAFMRRAGWAVRMAPELGGSYEQGPPSLIDNAQRDRRWCQGNLQHARFLLTPGLHWMSRLHLLGGIMSYLSAPIWLALVAVGVLLSMQAHFIRPEYFTEEFTLFPAWPRFDAERALALFLISLGVLLAPKLLGLVAALLRGWLGRGFGYVPGLAASTLAETLLSALYAPVLLWMQSGALVSILSGSDGGWRPQRRDDGRLPADEVGRRHRGHMLSAVAIGILCMLVSPLLLAWLTPTLVGLLLAIPLSQASGSDAIGRALGRIWLLAVPVERHPPPVVARLAEIMAGRTGAASAVASGVASGLRRVANEPRLRALHLAHLALSLTGQGRPLDTATALAEAKIRRASGRDEALAWLTPDEQAAVLSDPDLLTMLARDDAPAPRLEPRPGRIADGGPALALAAGTPEPDSGHDQAGPPPQ